MSNVPVSKLVPGVFGVSHGGGIAGAMVRSATQSWAGHAFGYLGGGMAISGQPPRAVIVPADTWDDAIWAHQMWDKLMSDDGWTAQQVAASQAAVVARYRAEEGCPYDFEAYGAFTAMVLHLRSEQQLAPDFDKGDVRVCSALVADGLGTGKVPLDFVPSDGPGIISDPARRIVLPPRLTAPGMLLGLGQRKEWM